MYTQITPTKIEELFWRKLIASSYSKLQIESSREG
jgi:hypothetical protein